MLLLALFGVDFESRRVADTQRQASICTRYLIKPGIPRGSEKPVGEKRALSPHLILTSAVIMPHCSRRRQIAFLPSPIF